MNIQEGSPRRGLTVEKFEGDLDEFRLAMAAFKRDMDAISDAYDELIRRYPDQWVAVHDGTTYHAETMAEIFAMLRAAGIDPANAATWHMTTEKLALFALR